MDDDASHNPPLSRWKRLGMIVFLGLAFGVAMSQLVDSNVTMMAAVGAIFGLVVAVVLSFVFRKHTGE